MSLQIEKLGDENYEIWHMAMKSLLVTADLWKVVCGRYVRDEGNPSEAEKWDTLDQKALAYMVLNVKPTQLMHIKACTTSEAAWKKLQQLHTQVGPIRKVQLYQKLLRFNMQQDENIGAHVNSFVETIERLAEMDIKINEELKVIMLLSSLPDTWEHFVVAIETRDELPTFEIVKVKLLEEGARKKEKAEREGNAASQAVYTYTQAKGNRDKGENNNTKRNERTSEKQKFNGKCFICEKPGHRASECRNKKKSATDSAKGHQASCVLHNYVDKRRQSVWCIDSGATCHMCCDRNMFETIDEKRKTSVMLAANKFVESQGVGIVKLQYKNTVLLLQNVLFVPELHMNFYSVSAAARYDICTTFNGKEALVKNKYGKVVLKAVQENNLYVYSEKSAVFTINSLSPAVNWHNRFGHLNFKDLELLSEKQLVHGMHIGNIEEKINCDTCNQAKLCSLPFPQKSNRVTKEVLELVHTDVCGPMNVKSIAGNRYFLTFIDDYSRKIYVYFLQTKSQVFERFKKFQSYVECQTGHKIKSLRSDNGTEYVNKEFTKHLEKCGIKRQLTVPYTPQQNGVAERANRTIVEMAKCLLIHAGLEEFLWAEAVTTAVYLRNRCPTRALAGGTPFEAWKGHKPSVKHMRVFGSRAFALDKCTKGKFKAKGKEYIFVGYSFEAKAYRLYDKQKRSIIERRDVRFVEGEFCTKTIKNCEPCEQNNDFMTNIIRLESCTYTPENKQIEHEEAVEDLRSDSGKEEEEFVSASDNEGSDEGNGRNEPQQDDTTPRRGPGRPRLVRTGQPGRPRKEYQVLNSLNYMDDIETPKSAADALQGQHSHDWQKSMQNEFDALQANDTWTLCELPPGHKAIGSKWVYRIKRSKDGDIESFKSRLVAQGCGQQFGVDYWETFSPVIRYETIRMLFAIAAEKQLFVHQVDIANAYLNSKLHEIVYMKQPPNFIDKHHPNKVLKLQKALYGLKQSGRVWNNTLDDVLKNMGFKRCKNEACLYIKQEQRKFSYIAVYVDDLIILCPSENDITEIKKKIASSFKMHDGGAINYFLGMEIERDGESGSIKMCQKTYIKGLLETYGMNSCRPVSTPLDPGYQVGCTSESCVQVNIKGFQSLIGSLMYLAVLSRPDILHAVSKLSQRNTDPHEEHEIAAKHILRYLAGTMNLSITYRKSGESVKGLVDADWANEKDRKSYSGYAFFMAGSAFSWSSTKQSVVALSSTKAEYIALSMAAKEAIYLRRLLHEIGWSEQPEPMTIFGDNISAQHIAQNPVHHKRTKHIDIKYHFIREKVESNDIVLEYVTTNDNVADVLTKCLNKNKHNGFVKNLGMI